MRKICVITGSRAEYGLLSGLMAKIQFDRDLQLQIIATNMHLSSEFGLTYKEIETDGFRIDKKVEMLLSSDTANGTAKSVGLATIGFADAFEDLSPDLILVLGDRFELLAAVSAALFYKIPVAHIHGGEITEGAYDDNIRHAITKMSHLHFTSAEPYRRRVIQLGESPDRVFNVGALGVENIKHVPLLSKEELEKSLNFQLGDKSLLVTFHPVTLENSTAEQQCMNLLESLESFPDYRIIFTFPNSDTDGRIIIDLIKRFVERHRIIEVPSFGIPTLNIGDRQKGRISSRSVVHCGTSKEDICLGIQTVLSDPVAGIAKQKRNPYDKEGTADAICTILKTVFLDGLTSKSFYDL